MNGVGDFHGCRGFLSESAYIEVKNALAKSNVGGGGEQLPQCAKTILAPHFPTLYLERTRIYTYIPAVIAYFAKISIGAITIDEEIYFNHRGYDSNTQSGYDPTIMDGIEIIAHELTHTTQYKNYKTIAGYGWDYRKQFNENKEKGMSDNDAYKDIRFEIDARANANRIMNIILAQYNNQQPCFNGQPNPITPAKPKGFSVDVEEVQKVLFALGYLTAAKYADGYWGNITKNALIRFQRNNGLPLDGIIGKNVLAKIRQPLGTLRKA